MCILVPFVSSPPQALQVTGEVRQTADPSWANINTTRALKDLLSRGLVADAGEGYFPTEPRWALPPRSPVGRLRRRAERHATGVHAEGEADDLALLAATAHEMDTPAQPTAGASQVPGPLTTLAAAARRPSTSAAVVAAGSSIVAGMGPSKGEACAAGVQLHAWLLCRLPSSGLLCLYSVTRRT